MASDLRRSSTKRKITALTEEMSRTINQAESGQEIAIETLQPLLARAEQLVNAVIELASEDAQLGAEFGEARRKLRVYLRNRCPYEQREQPPELLRYQGLIDLARSEGVLRGRQDQLEKEAWDLLIAGHAHEAADRLRETLDLLDRRRSFLSDERQQIYFAKEGIYLFTRFFKEYVRRQLWDGAFELIERMKSRALLNQLGLAAIRKPMDADSALVDTEEILLNRARETADAARYNATTLDGMRGFELWDRGIRLQSELDKIWASLAEDSRWTEYVSLRRGTAPDTVRIRKCLRSNDRSTGTALLNYFVDGTTTWLFVLAWDAAEPIAVNTGVSPEHLRACALRLLIDCNGLKHFRRQSEDTSLNDRIDESLKLPPEVGRLSRDLPEPNRRTLLRPNYAFTYLDDLSARLLPRAVHPYLENCEVLCISAHGALHGLPLHALRWTDGTYIADRFGICYVPSAGVLRHCQDRNRARYAEAPYGPQTGLVACVDMFGDQAAKFERDRDLLAHLTKQNGDQGDCQVLTGAEGPMAATKERVVRCAAAADVIHLSCHGVFAGDEGWKDPLQSGVLLADGRHTQIGREQLNGLDLTDCLLTAREIYTLNLRADMVVMSACSTGRVQVEAGDDLFGLSRAWLYAGTPSILLSLWEVNTDSSYRLLQLFYERWLQAGNSKWRALKEAQKILREDTTNQNFRHPYHWAPFVMIGDWI